MGNNNCKNSEGGYMIHLDKPYYYPGEIVHGKIYSHFIKNFESSSVEFEIKGEEYTCVNHKKTSKKNNNGTKKYSKSSIEIKCERNHRSPSLFLSLFATFSLEIFSPPNF